MKLINQYLNDLYKQDNSTEILELKEELYEYLKNLYDEFLSQGFNDEDAQKKAIYQFDGGDEIYMEIFKLIKKDNNYLKNKNTHLLSISNKTIKLSKIMIILSMSIIIFNLFITSYLGSSYKNIVNPYNVETKFKEEINKLVSSQDLSDIDTFKSKVDSLLIKSDFKDVVRLDLYTDLNDLYINNNSNLIYNYENKNHKGISTNSSIETTKKDLKGQTISYKVEIGNNIEYKSLSNVSVLFSGILLTFIVIYFFQKKLLKKYYNI